MAKIVRSIALLGLLIISGAWAEGAHVHGHATLQIILGEDKLQIRFSSPAANVVGFEHLPGNPQQKQKLLDAIELLKKGERLFVFAEGHCVLVNAQITTSLLNDDGRHHEHNDFEAEYTFKCLSMDKLQYIDVDLFDLFAGIEEIDVYLISDTSQETVALTMQQRRVNIK